MMTFVIVGSFLALDDVVLYLTQDQVGDAPLHDAIRLGHGEIAEYLIKCERFNFAITNGAGFNVLHLAAINGDTL